MAINNEILKEMAVIVIRNYYDGYYTKEYIILWGMVKFHTGGESPRTRASVPNR